MLFNAGLWHHHDFWDKAVSTTCYLVNRSPHSSIDFKIIEEGWSSNPVDCSILRIFRCSAYIYADDGKLTLGYQR